MRYNRFRILRIRGERRDMREDTRGGVATSPEVGSIVEEIPSCNLPPVTYLDLPEALPWRTGVGAWGRLYQHRAVFGRANHLTLHHLLS